MARSSRASYRGGTAQRHHTARRGGTAQRHHTARRGGTAQRHHTARRGGTAQRHHTARCSAKSGSEGLSSSRSLNCREAQPQLAQTSHSPPVHDPPWLIEQILLTIVLMRRHASPCDSNLSISCCCFLLARSGVDPVEAGASSSTGATPVGCVLLNSSQKSPALSLIPIIYSTPVAIRWYKETSRCMSLRRNLSRFLIRLVQNSSCT